jgi:hypothetical protein
VGVSVSHGIAMGLQQRLMRACIRAGTCDCDEW